MKRYVFVLAMTCALVLAVGMGSAFASGSLTIPSQSGSQDQDVKNETEQENNAGAISVPIASGNNLAGYNGGDQNANAGTTQNQGNFNWTRQRAFQGAFQWQATH